MKYLASILLFFSLYLFAAASCNKPGTPSGGGKGGNATIIARVDHYSYLLDTAVVWIKYGTLNAPASGVNYDDSLIADTNGRAVFSNLTTGSYYLFAQGQHNPLSIPTVEGGGPWTIGSSNEVDTFTIGATAQSFTFPPWWHRL